MWHIMLKQPNSTKAAETAAVKLAAMLPHLMRRWLLKRLWLQMRL